MEKRLVLSIVAMAALAWCTATVCLAGWPYDCSDPDICEDDPESSTGVRMGAMCAYLTICESEIERGELECKPYEFLCLANTPCTLVPWRWEPGEWIETPMGKMCVGGYWTGCHWTNECYAPCAWMYFEEGCFTANGTLTLAVDVKTMVYTPQPPYPEDPCAPYFVCSPLVMQVWRTWTPAQ